MSRLNPLELGLSAVHNLLEGAFLHVGYVALLSPSCGLRGRRGTSADVRSWRLETWNLCIGCRCMTAVHFSLFEEVKNLLAFTPMPLRSRPALFLLTLYLLVSPLVTSRLVTDQKAVTSRFHNWS
jgi:hypothetical protein